jgi:hypothetical protein
MSLAHPSSNADISRIIISATYQHIEQYIIPLYNDTSGVKEWPQPNLISNDSYGEVTYSVESSGSCRAYMALDNNSSTWWECGNNKTGWINWKLPINIDITKIEVVSRNGYSQYKIQYDLYVGTDLSTIVASTTSIGSESKVLLYSGNTITTNNIRINVTGFEWNYPGIQQIIITATYKTDANKIETIFNQPILTADGTLGGSSFAVAADTVLRAGAEAYKAFSADSINPNGTCWHAQSTGNIHWYTFYNPIPLKVNSLTMRNNSNGETWPVIAYKVQGSNDNVNWADLGSFTNSNFGSSQTYTAFVNSTNAYLYHRIYTTQCRGGYYEINHIFINAIQSMSTESLIKYAPVWMDNDEKVYYVAATTDETNPYASSIHCKISGDSNIYYILTNHKIK